MTAKTSPAPQFAGAEDFQDMSFPQEAVTEQLSTLSPAADAQPLYIFPRMKRQVNQALSAWTEQGYSLGAMRHPRQILGNSMLEQNMHGQTAPQLDRNFGIVRRYYENLVPHSILQCHPV